MSTERIFNIFVFFNGGSATEYGVFYHRVSGSDEEKKAYLLSTVEQDHPNARRFNFHRSFTPDEWYAVFRLVNPLDYFEEAFTQFRAGRAPVFCLTSVIDGKPTVDIQIGPELYRGDPVTALGRWGSVPDYLVHYMSENTFRFSDLMHDDYFKAIRMLFNAGSYVSCSKLLMSCVDTLGFVCL